MDEIEGLDAYHLLHAARADLLRRLGRAGEARAAYERALALATNPVEQSFLRDQLDQARERDQQQPDRDGKQQPEPDGAAGHQNSSAP
jgi:predicted RNA polymerase sigma factor